MVECEPGHIWKGYEITAEERLAIVMRGGFVCAYCGTPMGTLSPKNVTIDHLVPRSKGGLNRPDNLVPACRSCNSRKRDRPWKDYAPGGAQDRIKKQVKRPLNVALARAFIRGEIATDEEVRKA